MEDIVCIMLDTIDGGLYDTTIYRVLCRAYKVSVAYVCLVDTVLMHGSPALRSHRSLHYTLRCSVQ